MMITRQFLLSFIWVFAFGNASAQTGGWVSLFDGKTLNGWKSNEERPDVFSVVDGAIQVQGGRAHLFYVGKVNGGQFKNFELKAQVKTTFGANSGLYFHTAFVEKGWPKKGYECQVNSNHGDERRTGSLYGIKDVLKSPSKDGRWFELHLIVRGKEIIVHVDGKEVNRYLEPAQPKRLRVFKDRVLSEGTFAIQGHDPESVSYWRGIQVKVLP